MVYWVRICSRSLPRFISRSTGNGKIKPVLPHGRGWIRNPRGWRCPWGWSVTSAGQPDVRIRVDKEPEVEHVPNVLIVENQDPLKENNVSGINHRPLCQPARKNHQKHVSKQFSLHRQAACAQARLGTSTCAPQRFAQRRHLPRMGHKVVRWYLNRFALHDIFQGCMHQVVIKSICEREV